MLAVCGSFRMRIKHVRIAQHAEWFSLLRTPVWPPRKAIALLMYVWQSIQVRRLFSDRCTRMPALLSYVKRAVMIVHSWNDRSGHATAVRLSTRSTW
jgi:hypothetical protein